MRHPSMRLAILLLFVGSAIAQAQPSEVEQVQRWLAQFGYYEGTVTGQMNAATTLAIERFNRTSQAQSTSIRNAYVHLGTLARKAKTTDRCRVTFRFVGRGELATAGGCVAAVSQEEAQRFYARAREYVADDRDLSYNPSGPSIALALTLEAPETIRG